MARVMDKIREVLPLTQVGRESRNVPHVHLARSAFYGLAERGGGVVSWLHGQLERSKSGKSLQLFQAPATA